MPWRLDKMKSMPSMPEPHYHLYNLHKKEYAKKVFKSKEGAIGFAKNAIKFREKKDSKVIVKNGKTFIMPK